MSGLPAEPGPRHRVVAARFGEVVAGTTDWTVPAPVEGWTAADVVGHLTSWFPAFLHGATGHTLRPTPGDPVAAWARQSAEVQGLLDDPASAEHVLTVPHAAGLRLEQAITSFYTADVFMHTWDLARATGQDDRLDPDACAELLDGMRQMEEPMRSSGQYGPAYPVPDDADVQDRLLGFIGRDPGWRPPRAA